MSKITNPSKEYILVEVGVQQFSPNHIPYIIYGIVRGPRGGTIILDEYNLERIFRARLDSYTTPRINEFIMSMARHYGMLKVWNLSSFEIMDDSAPLTIADKYGIPHDRVCRRNRRKTKVNKIIEHFHMPEIKVEK